MCACVCRKLHLSSKNTPKMTINTPKKHHEKRADLEGGVSTWPARGTESAFFIWPESLAVFTLFVAESAACQFNGQAGWKTRVYHMFLYVLHMLVRFSKYFQLFLRLFARSYTWGRGTQTLCYVQFCLWNKWAGAARSYQKLLDAAKSCQESPEAPRAGYKPYAMLCYVQCCIWNKCEMVRNMYGTAAE